MLVVSLNIYVGRDFRKWFSPILLLQAGLMSTLEQDARGLLQSYSWCLTRGFPACPVPLCRSPREMCSVEPLSSAPRQPSKGFGTSAGSQVLWPVIVRLPVCAWKPFSAHLAFLRWAGALRQRKVNVLCGSIGRKNTVGSNPLSYQEGQIQEDILAVKTNNELAFYSLDLGFFLLYFICH